MLEPNLLDKTFYSCSKALASSLNSDLLGNIICLIKFIYTEHEHKLELILLDELLP